MYGWVIVTMYWSRREYACGESKACRSDGCEHEEKKIFVFDGL